MEQLKQYIFDDRFKFFVDYFKTFHFNAKLDVLEFNRYELLENYLIENISLFENNRSNTPCILILISAILSRGLDRYVFFHFSSIMILCKFANNSLIRDLEPTSTLLGKDLECSNELINLLIIGHAVSDFLNDIHDSSMLGAVKKGPKQRSDVGFLSCADKIGSFYKTPRFPIWIVRLADHHFGLVFSLKKDILNDWKAECVFNLYFYEFGEEMLVRRLTVCKWVFKHEINTAINIYFGCI